MANVIVTVVIAGILVLPVIKILRDKKKNIRCSGCSACPMSSDCSPKEK